jgi:hypothetical protein
VSRVIEQAYVDTAVCSVISGCTSSKRFEKIAESTLNRFTYLRRIVAAFGVVVGVEIIPVKNFRPRRAARPMAAYENAEISTAEFAQFQRLIYKIAGISLADSKKILLAGRLGKRLRHLGLSSFGEYYRLVSSGRGRANCRPWSTC